MDKPSSAERRPRSLLPAALAAVVVAAAFGYVFVSTSGQTIPSAPVVSIPPIASPTSTTTTTTPLPPVAQDAPSSIPPGWTLLPPGPLSPRIGHAAVWTGTDLILWGGRTMLDPLSSGAVYSPAARSWTSLPEAPVLSRLQPAGAWTGDKLVAFAEGVSAIDPDDGVWDSASYPPTVPSHQLAAAWTGDEVIGVGYGEDPGVPWDNTFAVAVTPGDTCCRSVPPPPIDLTYGQAFWTGEHVLLIGGLERHVETASAMPGFARYDPRSDAWTELERPPLDGARELSAAWTDKGLVVVDWLMRSAIWDNENGWQRLQNAPFEFHECFPQAVAVGDVVFVWYCRQAAILDTSTLQWTLVATPELDPHAVSTSCQPVTANELVLMWCGNSPAAPMFWEIDPGATVADVEWQQLKLGSLLPAVGNRTI